MHRLMICWLIGLAGFVGCGGDAQPVARRSEPAASSPESATPSAAPVAESPAAAAPSSDAPKDTPAEKSTAEKSTAETTKETPASGGEESANKESANKESANKLELDQLVFVIPREWQQKPAASSFVLAEFTLPRVEGDDADGRLTVSTAGGSVEANVQRWRDQFGGKPAQAAEERKEIQGLEVVFVDLSGEFNDQRGPAAPATKRQHYRMAAAIVATEGQLHFIKAVGPQATIAAHADRFREFVGSLTKK